METQTVVHVTHEAIQKIGGIGAVLQGLLTSKVYLQAAPRNILVGPFGRPTKAGNAGWDDGGSAFCCWRRFSPADPAAPAPPAAAPAPAPKPPPQPRDRR